MTTNILLSLFFVLFNFFPCDAKQGYVQEGDIVVWIDKEVEQGNAMYADQVRLAYLQAAGKAAGIYDPIDPDLSTWDNTTTPLVHYRGFCIHIELITHSGMYQFDSDYLVILRPTPRLLQYVDMDVAISKKLEVDSWGMNYNQPELYVILKWWSQNPIGTTGWVTDTAKAHWLEAYGIDCDSGLKAAQWSPCLGRDCHYDFSCHAFWLRDMDCSSSTWWYLWWGYFEKGDTAFNTWLIEHKDWVDASDCLAPGLVAEYLLRHGYVTITRIYR
ncbi:MAG: hypothetical protein BA863_03610 [Desulfovibrio sp. S3730MH75]|nr:MAG: hypothetical protein BA863_03610 [Desulfovibrio sp. S3730MH75]